MSTSPDTQDRVDDRLIALISRWLGRHIGNEELRSAIEQSRTEDLELSQAVAVRELTEELRKVDPGERGHVEMVARETIEVIALGE